MLDALGSPTFAQAEQGLREIGYDDSLLRRDYDFADLLSAAGSVRRVPLAAFAQDPPSYRNACFGVLVGARDQDITRYRALGAPQLLQILDHEVRRWKVTSFDEPTLLQRIAPDDLLRTIREHRVEWGPEPVLRARSIAFDAAPIQLDFFDAGLLPAIEAVVNTKLDRLLRDALAASRAAYEEHHIEPLDYAKLFRLIFRLLAAKLLSDRGQPGDWLSGNPSAVVAAVENFYFRSGEAEPVLEDPIAQQIAWSKIRSGFHLQNISVEALAYVYENTFVGRETRRRYGTHSTPREVAEYLARRLPFEVLPLDQRLVFEPFAGHAALLIAGMARLRALLPNDTQPAERHDYFVRMLAGLEIDPFAREVASLSLMLADYPNPDGWRVLEGDVFDSTLLETQVASAQAVLCNPPFEDFTDEERRRYRQLRSVNKAAHTLLRILERPPELLGFVLPRPFIDGQYYRDARQLVAQNYGSVELVALPDSAFHNSGVETVLLIAYDKGRPLTRLRSADVTKKDYVQFVRTGRPTREEDGHPAPGPVASPLLWLRPLQRVWQTLEGLQTLADAADIRNGIYYQLSLREHADLLVSSEPRRGFRPGLIRIRDGFEPLAIVGHVYLNTDPAVMYERSKAHLLAWDSPKVIVNKGRLSRGPWVVAGAPDHLGLTVFHLFHAMWPRGEFPIEVLAAIVNGPVANAFMAGNRTSRDNRIDTINRIPIPRFEPGALMRISAAVIEYQTARADWAEIRSDQDEAAARCRRALYQIDAELLKAYDLPPRIERELLDYFAGHRRPGPVEFHRYFPDGFRPALPWHSYISGAAQRASARSTLARLPILQDPAISEFVAELG
jgi:hypothetical protein